MLTGEAVPTLRRRLRLFREKNGDELGALFAGRMPRFVTRTPTILDSAHPIVLVFHDVEPVSFEQQLSYLAVNRYRVLDLEEAVAAVAGHGWPRRSVLLTFDDATSSFWTYALPLLRRYRMSATLFAIPGLVAEGRPRPSLNDRWAGEVTDGQLEQARESDPLCNWAELERCVESGLVDVQCHSLTHSRIPISSSVIDVQTPQFSVGAFANSDIPLSSLDDPEMPSRELRLGAPVFGYASRFSESRRFLLEPAREREMIDFVAQRGGDQFFVAPDWRKSWLHEFGVDQAAYGRFETESEQDAAIERELVESKRLLEERLGIAAQDLCLPWYGCSAKVARIAADSGYRSLFFGVNRLPKVPEGLIAIPRVSEQYCLRLPGSGRVTLGSVWLDRLRKARGT